MQKYNMSDLGDRMRIYEEASRYVLPRRLPIIIRVDGKAFHTYTRGCKKPFDEGVDVAMDAAARALCEGIGGSQLAYVQSDEVSVLMHCYKKLDSQPWFANEVQKIVSIAASIASVAFTLESNRIWENSGKSNLVFGALKPAHFDARVFVLPEAEVCNYFIGRQQDAIRNSVSALAQSMYSNKQLHGKSTKSRYDMCFEKGVNWDELPMYQQRGRCALKAPMLAGTEQTDRMIWLIDRNIPAFTQDRAYIEKHLEREE